ncbi:MAG: 4-hydroxy-tetrahydrodipicolinate synthase [Planctomycetes bacterium]|nr:4-hydroxy-tetrahydrodipicolinate synthase [Planctomycetota bacterium]MBI3833528.1 4-hydroxy-tetrahydrodipicolinate synthase [Planctomycetota bacterium]
MEQTRRTGVTESTTTTALVEKSTEKSVAGSMRGAMTALVTPFRDGEIDLPALDRLVDRQIAGGTDWLVALGTTGESPTITDDERERIIKSVLTRSGDRCRVMVGTGTNCTNHTIEYTRRAAKLGAQAALVVTPYYNRPTQEGMFAHFSAVADTVEIPIILYNVPIRTGVNLHNDTVARLREKHRNIIAIKDASGTVDGVTDLTSRSDIAVLCGDDVLTLPMMSLGAVGVISVISNLAPKLMKSLVDAAASGNISEAQRLHRRVFDLATGIGRFGPNPIPIKTALTIAGMISEEFRLPLLPLAAEARDGIERVLRRHEIGGAES